QVTDEELKQLQPLAGKGMLKDRSRCLHCHKTLRWYDMLPIVSWLFLGGKCRYCKKSIGLMEPLLEVGLAAFFVLSYIFWPFALDDGLSIARFVVWLLAGTALAIQFAYDIKWFLLPDKVSLILAVLGLAMAAIVVMESPQPMVTVF